MNYDCLTGNVEFIEKTHQYFENGVELKSVTTILKATQDEKSKAKILKWQKKMDSLQNIDANISNPLKRGTEVHREIEEALLSENPLRYKFTTWAKNIDGLLGKISLNPYMSELIVGGEYCGYAGRFDLICTLSKKITMLDFVTSYRIKKIEWISHKFIQAAAYADAINIYNSTRSQICENIDNLAIVVILENDYQLFTKPLSDYLPLWKERKKTYFSGI